MTAVSLSITRGLSGTKMVDVTAGTSAPAAGDIEFKWNTVDTASPTPGVITRKDLLLALEAFERFVVAGTYATPTYTAIFKYGEVGGV